MHDEDGEWLSFEHLSVLQWRTTKPGGRFHDVEAKLFAESDRDLGELRKLVKAGCTAEQIRAIVL